MDAPNSASPAAPAVSVVIPVYKTEKYLAECIESVLAQTFEDFEMILVDDGSPDNSGKICDDYAARDSRVRVFHKENGGVTSARRLGVERSRAEWITFVDSDDKLFPNALRDLIDLASAHPNADLVEASITRDENLRDLSSTCLGEQSTFCATGLEYAIDVASQKMVWIPGPVAKIIRKSVLISTKALDLPVWIDYGEDLMMNIICASKLRKAVKSDIVIYFYRRNLNGAALGKKRTAQYFCRWLEFCETVLPAGWEAVWIGAARHYFVQMFLKCDDWEPRQKYPQKIINKIRTGRNVPVGTRICLLGNTISQKIKWLPMKRFCAMLADVHRLGRKFFVV